MTYGKAIEALGDPTRRAIFERLRRGPTPVGELAATLPVSRPAVSQHLRVLKEAGLVTERRQGTRRLYRLDPDGLGAVRSYFDGFWTEVFADFKAAADTKEKEMTMQAEDLVIRKSVTVAVPLEEAFGVFTERLESWWPLETHSIGKERIETVVVDGRTGGRVYERLEDGTEAHWATVTAWEPPRRLVLSWHVNQERPVSTEVEVRFSEEGTGTRVDLEHRGWERYEDAHEASARYETGWDLVLGRYMQAADARSEKFHNPVLPSRTETI